MSNITIKVINVAFQTKQTRAGKPYGVALVTFQDGEGKVSTFQVLDFKSKEAYRKLKDLPANTNVVVSREKDGEYWVWTDLSVTTDAPTSTPSAGRAATPSPSPRSTYETPEERAARQRLIVRQSSLTAALAFTNNTKAATSLDDILQVAETFTNWVFEKGLPAGDSMADMQDDIPF